MAKPKHGRARTRGGSVKVELSDQGEVLRARDLDDALGAPKGLGACLSELETVRMKDAYLSTMTIQ